MAGFAKDFSILAKQELRHWVVRVIVDYEMSLSLVADEPFAHSGTSSTNLSVRTDRGIPARGFLHGYVLVQRGEERVGVHLENIVRLSAGHGGEREEREEYDEFSHQLVRSWRRRVRLEE
jgi:hypothetical protein